MRESVGSTWLFMIVTCFTLIFAGFLVMALNYSKTYKLKNELSSIIEKYEGLTTTDKSGREITGSINIMNTYLRNSNYEGSGNCYQDPTVYNMSNTKTVSYGLYVDSEKIEVAQEGVKYDYCVLQITNQSNCTTLFRVTVFYEFNLPVFGRLTNFRISGQTNEVTNAFINDTMVKCN